MQGSQARSLADATRGVVVRPVTGAEPAAEVTRLSKRHAAQVRADSDHDNSVLPPLPGRAGKIGCGLVIDKVGVARQRILKISKCSRPGRLDLLRGAVANEDWPTSSLDRQ